MSTACRAKRRKARRASTAASGVWDGFSKKRCPRCERHLQLILGTTFNSHANTHDGHQPWCIECDRTNKALDLDYAWTQFQAACERDGTRHAWTQREFVELLLPDRCHWCKGRLSIYGSGFKLDRVDNCLPHEQHNCVPACAGCNMKRGDLHPEAWSTEVLGYLARYGEGKVPWHIICQKKIRLHRIPDLRPYVLEVQTALFLPDVTAPNAHRSRTLGAENRDRALLDSMRKRTA